MLSMQDAIRRVIVAGSSSHYCPNCQRATEARKKLRKRSEAAAMGKESNKR